MAARILTPVCARHSSRICKARGVHALNALLDARKGADVERDATLGFQIVNVVKQAPWFHLAAQVRELWVHL